MQWQATEDVRLKAGPLASFLDPMRSIEHLEPRRGPLWEQCEHPETGQLATGEGRGGGVAVGDEQGAAALLRGECQRLAGRFGERFVIKSLANYEWSAARGYAPARSRQPGGAGPQRHHRRHQDQGRPFHLRRTWRAGKWRSMWLTAASCGRTSSSWWRTR